MYEACARCWVSSCTEDGCSPSSLSDTSEWFSSSYYVYSLAQCNIATSNHRDDMKGMETPLGWFATISFSTIDI